MEMARSWARVSHAIRPSRSEPVFGPITAIESSSPAIAAASLARKALTEPDQRSPLRSRLPRHDPRRRQLERLVGDVREGQPRAAAPFSVWRRSARAFS